MNAKKLKPGEWEMRKACRCKGPTRLMLNSRFAIPWPHCVRCKKPWKLETA